MLSPITSHKLKSTDLQPYAKKISKAKEIFFHVSSRETFLLCNKL